MLESEADKTKKSLTDGIQKIWAPGQPPGNASFKATQHPRRKALLQLLRQTNSHYIAVAVNKHQLTEAQQARLKCPKLYHFLAKYMLERLTWYAKDRGGIVNVTFGARKQIKFANLESYLLGTLRTPFSSKSHFIEYAHLGNLRESPTASNVLLQGADWVASGLAQGLNQDQHGNLELTYAQLMWGDFWLRKGALWQRGITLIPTNLDRKTIQLFKKIDTWLEDPTTLV